MSLFVDLRQIKSSVTNLSEMVDKISASVKRDTQPDIPKKDPSVLYSTMYKPTTLGFGVRFSSQEDILRDMPSSRLRSHMSLPNLGKPVDAGFERPSTSREARPRIEEIDDEKSDTSKPAIQLSAEEFSDWLVASLNKRPNFDDTGDTHPMDFIETVKYYISELNMSQDKQLPFIISCLDGVPLMWARCFRNEFKDADSFYEAFEQEFWGQDRQKSVLYDMKLGKYDDTNTRMSMSEYFLHKVSNYRHLNPPPSDLEIVYSLAAHFPSTVELEMRLAPKPSLRDAYRLLRRRDGESGEFLPNYLYEMCEAYQRGQRPDSARRYDQSHSLSSSDHRPKTPKALHESEGNWTESDCVEARRAGALWGVQVRACRRQPAALRAVAAAARLARASCRAAHQGERWNCSSIDSSPRYSPDLLTGTREQAYVYAISAASLVWSVARACASGSLAACSCAAPPRAPPRPPRQVQLSPTEPHARFKWGGCGDNYQWAERFAKQFLDAHEMDVRDGKEDFFEIEETTTTEATTTAIPESTTSAPVVILVDDQPAPANITASPRTKKRRKGRKRLPRSPRRGRPTRKRFRQRYEYEDRGSRYRNIEYRMAADDPRFDPQVDLRTRLERLRPLIAEANLLNGRFGRKAVSSGMRTKCTCHGVSGSCSVRTCWRALPPLARVATALAAATTRAGPLRPARHARTHRARLRYVTPSPDYCEPDVAAGSLGTHGRKCNATLGSAPGGCGRLCCGRGRRAVRSSRLERCHCRYHWCCRVDCQLCRLSSEEHYCN